MQFSKLDCNIFAESDCNFESDCICFTIGSNAFPAFVFDKKNCENQPIMKSIISLRLLEIGEILARPIKGRL